jgi:hypothetical protein
MASCGTPTSSLAPGKASESLHNPNRSGRNEYWRSTACMLFALAFLAVLVGCTQTLLKLGSPPRTDQLDTLKLGDSTKADVLLALGQPQGDGVVRFAVERTPRTIWSYDYTEAKVGIGWAASAKVVGLRVLLVFFDQDKYAGHLWFASAPDLPKAH